MLLNTNLKDLFPNPRGETQVWAKVYFLSLIVCALFRKWSFSLWKLWLTASGSRAFWAAFPRSPLPNERIRHQIVFAKERHTSMSFVLFFSLAFKKMTSISVVRIQKGFLVWNICNPFVVESTLLPALPKVFILPVDSSSLWLALAKGWYQPYSVQVFKGCNNTWPPLVLLSHWTQFRFS